MRWLFGRKLTIAARPRPAAVLELAELATVGGPLVDGRATRAAFGKATKAVAEWWP